VTRFELPAPVLLAGSGLESRLQEPEMTSPYLDRPLLPLAVVLPRLLESVETELAKKFEPVQESHLRHRAELIHWLLATRHLR
jgi:hypothetical protein